MESLGSAGEGQPETVVHKYSYQMINQTAEIEIGHDQLFVPKK